MFYLLALAWSLGAVTTAPIQSETNKLSLLWNIEALDLLTRYNASHTPE